MGVCVCLLWVCACVFYRQFANVALKLMEYAAREENIQAEMDAMEERMAA